MADPALALQKAVLSTLAAAVSCPVHDAVPQGAPLPYVSIDSTAVADGGFVDTRLDDRYIYLSVWSRARGSAEVQQIMAEISEIHLQRVTLDDGQTVSFHVERKRSTREPDGLTFQGAVTLRVLTTS